jgi:hypothetical protein
VDARTSTPNVAASGAWLSLFTEETGGWTRYLGSAGSNSEGVAAFYVDTEDQDASFTVEIHPPHNLRSTQARKAYSGLTWAQVKDLSFALGQPNLTLTIKQSRTPYAASSWSNVWIQKVGGAPQYANGEWVGGYGSDETGVIPLSLAAGFSYRINVNPGPGSVGTRTSCIVSVTGSSSNTVVSIVAGQCDTGTLTGSAMDLKLSAGNFTGIVTLQGGGPAVGAIVFARSTTGDFTQETVVEPDGSYGLQLDPALDWEVKVFYVNPVGAQTRHSSMTTPVPVAKVGGLFTRGEFELQTIEPN